MCWSIFFTLVIAWRIIRMLLGLLAHILGLIPLIGVRLFQASYPRRLEAHRPHDPRIEMALGLLLCGGSGIGSVVFLNAPLLAGFFFILALLVLGLLLSGRFHPLTMFLRPKIGFLTPGQVRVFNISVSGDQVWQAQQALYFVQQLLAACPEIILQIHADAASIRWRIIVPIQGVSANVLKKIIYAHYPDCHITVERLADERQLRDRIQSAAFCDQSEPFALPLQALAKLKAVDVVQALSGLMNDLHLGEQLVFNLALGGNAYHATFIGQQQISRSSIHPFHFLTRGGVQDAWGRITDGQDRQIRDLDFDLRLVQPKLQSNLYFASFWVQAQAKDEFRLQHLLILAHSYIRSVSIRPYNMLIQVSQMQSTGSSLAQDILDIYRHWRLGQASIPTLVLNAEELTLLWHLPHREITASRVQRVKKLRPLSEVLATVRDGIVLGKAPYHHEWVNARIGIADRRDHCNIIGRSGTGKSTLLDWMARQDIAAGHGVAVIQPHLSVDEMIIRFDIPPEREADVVVIDLADTEYPVPLNPFAIRHSKEDVFRIVGIIERFFEGTDQAVQISAYLRAAVLLLSQQDEITIKDLTYLLLDAEYRERLLLQCDDPDIRLYLGKQYHRASERQKSHIADPILNRIRAFYINRLLYLMVCHPHCLDFKQLIDEKKIILISLNTDDAKVPLQERNLLGTLIMSQLQMAGMSRPPGSEPYFTYIDEVQTLVTTSLDKVFSEARKNGLVMTTAHQYLGQLKGDTLEAILGNIGTLVSFRCGPKDGGALSDYTKPEFLEHDLLNLDNYMAVVKMKAYKTVQPSFTLRTINLPAPRADAAERVRRIKQLSRQRYTPMHRDEVLHWLNQRYAIDDED